MHYISVKQEHEVTGPGQLFGVDSHHIADPVVERRKVAEIIDLCDSDDESTEGNPPGSSSAGTPNSDQNHNETNSVSSDATLQSRPGPGTSLLTTSQARTSSKSKILPATVTPNPVQDISSSATIPATDIPPVTQSYWRKRIEPASQSEPTATQIQNTSTLGPSTSAKSPATTCTTGTAKPRTKKQTLKPKSEHPHKYRGPELEVISLRAVWNHLDQAWKQASCTVQTIKRLQSWWNTNVVTSTHQLNKHQVYLLLFAQYQWWQALEEQWNKFDALPDKDRKVIMKMREIRLRKESYAVKAEAALVNEGITKNHDAVYVLGGGVKKEKMDEKVIKEKGESEKRKRAGPVDADAEVHEEGEGVQAKRVRFGSGEIANNGVNGVVRRDKGGAEEEEVDDGLSSDSDEEED